MKLIMPVVIAAIVVALLVIIITMYNSLIKARQRVKNSWSQIDVQLQRRFDLMPNLLETVKGYMQHESETLVKIAKLRTDWSTSTTMTKKAELGNELESVLNKLIAVSENYPELKANTGFLELQQQIKETENKITFSRQFYNDCVTMYNTKLETFPSNMIAGLFQFKPEMLFYLETEDARKNVHMKIN